MTETMDITQKSIQTVQVVELIQNMIEGIAERKTEELVDMFNGVKALNKASKDFQEAARLELLGRATTEGGQDDKGHRYLSGEQSGLQVQRRVSYGLTPDAEERLAEADLLDTYFPKAFDAEQAEQLLRNMPGIPELLYTRPVVTTKTVETVASLGHIPADLLVEIITEKVTHAAVEIKREAAQLP